MFVETKFFHKAGEGSGGGSDPHNLGYYADLTALQTAHPTGTDGDFAILGSTDTIWVWDSGTSAWKDTDTKGQVTSVNNQTGAVTLDINDVAPTQTGKSGYVLGTDGFVAGWVKPEIVQVSALPAASEDEVDNIYQFVGTTDANYTNGYFYKCVSDGQNPATYSWTQTNVQPAGSSLPSQTGNSGKFLTTDGTDASWSGNLVLLTFNTIIGFSTSYSGSYNVVIGNNSNCGYGNYETVIGSSAFATANYTLAAGANSSARQANSIALGARTSANATNAIQLGSTGAQTTNSDANTFKVANANGNFEMMSADGTIPADRLPNAINKYSSMPTASSTNVGWIVQYTGATDSTYTHGYIYECVSDGGNPATYSWSAVSVQAGGGGGLPSQTGNAGKFLTTDGTDASWSDKPLVNTATGNVSLTIAGTPSSAVGATNIGVSSNVTGLTGTAVGYQAVATGAGSIQLGSGTNSNDGTFCVATTKNYLATNRMLLDADGNIPTDRFTTTPVVDGTYVPTLTISSGVATRSWSAPGGGGSTALSLTLAAANWSNNTITVTATGVTASNNVIVSPAPASQSAYTTAGVMCTAQATDSLTFTCTTTPSSDLTVTVLII